MGTPYFAVPILKSLYQNGYPISVVYTQPPKKSKRGQKINKSPIQGISETLNIELCKILSNNKTNIFLASFCYKKSKKKGVINIPIKFLSIHIDVYNLH